MTEKKEMGRELWNERVAAHGGSLLQSWEWGELQKPLGREVRRIATDDMLALVVRYELPFGKNYWYAPHGPVLTNTRHIFGGFASENWEGAIFLKIEPALPDTPENAAMLHAAGFRRGRDTQPSETRLIDLTKPEPELLHEMEHDTRYAIRAAGRRGVTVTIARTADEKTHAFSVFWDLFEQTNVRHDLHAYDKRYYEAVAKLQGDLPAQAGCYTELFIAELEGETIAAAIVAYFGKRAYYLYAASKAGMGKFNAPSLILWEAIRGAKQKFSTTFDLWGVSETKGEWKGVTAFKKSFGGKAVKMIGTWEYPLRPLWYWAYRCVKRII
ncbi:MAG: peptidoglycan bridge formation glycyltransferase FemA/FemB family protein [Candidatus Jorgensenbacteria bacterium]